MFVPYWRVGTTSSTDLQLTAAEIGTLLAEDWVPSVSAATSATFFGWAPHLIHGATVQGKQYLSLDRRLGRAERQWKQMLSWLLGVAGARRVMQDENYQWIAPLSAFYPAATKVDIPKWHGDFLPGMLVATKNPSSTRKLRPDYVALRKLQDGTFDWALVEAKGTTKRLSGMQKCSTEWYEQAQNARILHRGSEVTVSRHIVVATRCNPDAERETSRRLEIRAWNSALPPSPPPLEAVVEVVAAHLFGVCLNLQLYDVAGGIAAAVQARAAKTLNVEPFRLDTLEGMRRRALAEIQATLHLDGLSDVTGPHRSVSIETPNFDAQISVETARLIEQLVLVDDDSSAAAAVSRTSSVLEGRVVGKVERGMSFRSGLTVSPRTKSL